MYLRGEVWWLRAKVAGHDCRESLHTSDVREARRFRDKRLKEIEGEAWRGEHRVSWKEAVVAWVEHTKGQVSDSTLKRYAVSIQQTLPHLEPLSVDKIDAKTIAALVQARRHGGATPATVKRDLTAISSVLRFAQASGQREGNPALDGGPAPTRAPRSDLPSKRERYCRGLRRRVARVCGLHCRRATHRRSAGRACRRQVAGLQRHGRDAGNHRQRIEAQSHRPRAVRPCAYQRTGAPGRAYLLPC
jgi:integrase/recombinase XerD